MSEIIKFTVPASPNDTEVSIDKGEPIITYPDPIITFKTIEKPNQPPVVTIGQTTDITLPVNEITLSVQASDVDGVITSIFWSKVSGRNAIIQNPISAQTKVTGLEEGSYVFNVEVTDDDGAKVSRQAVVVVNPPVTVEPPKETIFPFVVTPRTDSYLRQNCGSNRWINAWPWNDSYAVKTPSGNATALSYYTRFWWMDIQKDDGSFDWTIFDQRIHDAIDKKQTFSFGIMTQYSGNGKSVDGAILSYPLFLHKQYQTETTKDHIYKGSWVHNWNSQFYHNAHNALNKAVNDHIENGTYNGVKYKNVIFQIDIRGYGEVGEWWFETADTQNKPTAESLVKIIDSHLENYPNYWLCILHGAFDKYNYSRMPQAVIDYVVKARNLRGDIGYRRDNFGDTGYGQWIDAVPAMAARWMTAPVVGEPMNDKTAVSRNCGSAYCGLPDEVKKYHVNSIGNGNYPGIDAATINNVRIADQLMGYRIGITGGQAKLGSEIEITVNWANTGLCPSYDKWVMEYSIGIWVAQSSFTPELFRDTKTVVESFQRPSLPPGTYDLKITVKDPNGYRQNLPINTNMTCKITL